MNAAAPSGDGMRSLRTAAALCLASPLAACVVLPDGTLHVFNEPYRALFGANAPALSDALRGRRRSSRRRSARALSRSR